MRLKRRKRPMRTTLKLMRRTYDGALEVIFESTVEHETHTIQRAVVDGPHQRGAGERYELHAEVETP